MPLNSLRISLADYVQLPFRRDSCSGQPSVIHITTSKGDSRLHTSASVAIVRFTEYVRNNRLPEPVIRVKQPALARFSPDVSPLFVRFAQTMTSLPGCMRKVTDCGLSFLSDVKSC